MVWFMSRSFFAAGAAALVSVALVACNDSVVTAPAPRMTITELAADNPQLTTLVSALTSTGLASTLQGPGPFTVFAPTNAAFDALPPGTLASLTNQQLTNILLFHVSSGASPASVLSGLTSLPTLFNNTSVTIVPTGNTLRINNQATVIQADIQASNGFVHVIDNVLLPTAF